VFVVLRVVVVCFGVLVFAGCIESTPEEELAEEIRELVGDHLIRQTRSRMEAQVLSVDDGVDFDQLFESLVGLGWEPPLEPDRQYLATFDREYGDDDCGLIVDLFRDGTAHLVVSCFVDTVG